MNINYAGRIEVSRPMSKTERNAYIREHFDIAGLRELGFWINGERTFDAYEQRILTFFGFKDIREFSQLDETVFGIVCLEGANPLLVNRGRIEGGGKK